MRGQHPKRTYLMCHGGHNCTYILTHAPAALRTVSTRWLDASRRTGHLGGHAALGHLLLEQKQTHSVGTTRRTSFLEEFERWELAWAARVHRLGAERRDKRSERSKMKHCPQLPFARVRSTNQQHATVHKQFIDWARGRGAVQKSHKSRSGCARAPARMARR